MKVSCKSPGCTFVGRTAWHLFEHRLVEHRDPYARAVTEVRQQIEVRLAELEAERKPPKTAPKGTDQALPPSARAPSAAVAPERPPPKPAPAAPLPPFVVLCRSCRGELGGANALGPAQRLAGQHMSQVVGHVAIVRERALLVAPPAGGST